MPYLRAVLWVGRAEVFFVSLQFERCCECCHLVDTLRSVTGTKNQDELIYFLVIVIAATLVLILDLTSPFQWHLVCLCLCYGLWSFLKLLGHRTWWKTKKTNTFSILHTKYGGRARNVFTQPELRLCKRYLITSWICQSCCYTNVVSSFVDCTYI